MNNTAIYIFIALAIAVSFLAFIRWRKEQSLNQAASSARKVFPVWAAQGPFLSGEESAAAMRYAYLAVYGPEEAEDNGMNEAITNHAIAYDNNPSDWIKNRWLALESSNSATDEYVVIAKGFAAIDSLFSTGSD
ncbi:MAG: hypothetical protein HOM43_00590 [Flavobacteriales bacterium]|jgi:hypothetical protein|nr:hypothetical protein [Flavobacteriales bacterium]